MMLLHRYQPCSVEALTMLASADSAERQIAAYNADMPWLLCRMLAGKGSRLEAPSSFARRFDRARIVDTRSAEQILDDVARIAEKGGRNCGDKTV